MDYYYNSPELAHFLKRQNTNCVGTLRLEQEECTTRSENQETQEGKDSMPAFRTSISLEMV
jgi:hypothetical protein